MLFPTLGVMVIWRYRGHLNFHIGHHFAFCLSLGLYSISIAILASWNPLTNNHHDIILCTTGNMVIWRYTILCLTVLGIVWKDKDPQYVLSCGKDGFLFCHNFFKADHPVNNVNPVTIDISPAGRLVHALSNKLPHTMDGESHLWLWSFCLSHTFCMFRSVLWLFHFVLHGLADVSVFMIE
jgi:hypothetical protein